MDLLAHTIFPSWTALAATAGVMALAQLVYALYGFGSGLIAVSMLAFVLPDLSLLVPLLLLVNLPTEAWVSWRDRRAISFRDAGWLLPGMIAGLLAGTWLLAHAGDQAWLLRCLGGVVVAFAGWLLWDSLRAERARPHRLPGPLGGLVGLVAGALGAMFGTGGPPVILWFQLQGLPKSAFRATLLGLFLVMSAGRLPSYGAAGLFTPPVLVSAAVVLPAGLLGLLAGNKLHLEIPERRFRQGVAAVLGVLGVMLVW
jgi:uncharacterized membrane protein YfcA